MPNLERPLEVSDQAVEGAIQGYDLMESRHQVLTSVEAIHEVEPTAELIGKMSELSFQKHGGPDNSTMPQRL